MTAATTASLQGELRHLDSVLAEVAEYNGDRAREYLENRRQEAADAAEYELSEHPEGNYFEKLCRGVELAVRRTESIDEFADWYADYARDFTDEKGGDAKEAVSRITALLEPGSD
ncbi:MAG: hypothetical protein SVY41_01125 [Candidatus Nanohaloarchaea archaeon]|nr:hypothetical protein [Candidatus Nanohaloarchaea archaeon]